MNLTTGGTDTKNFLNQSVYSLLSVVKDRFICSGALTLGQ